jgi:hypothetical protein
VHERQNQYGEKDLFRRSLPLPGRTGPQCPPRSSLRSEIVSNTPSVRGLSYNPPPWTTSDRHYGFVSGFEIATVLTNDACSYSGIPFDLFVVFLPDRHDAHSVVADYLPCFKDRIRIDEKKNISRKRIWERYSKRQKYGFRRNHPAHIGLQVVKIKFICKMVLSMKIALQPLVVTSKFGNTLVTRLAAMQRLRRSCMHRQWN